MPSEANHRPDELARSERRDHRTAIARQRRTVLGDGATQRIEACGQRRVDVGVLDEELHRTELSLTGLAHRPRHAGRHREVGITGRVHEHATRHGLRTLLRGDHDAGDVTVVVANNIGDQRVQQQGDALRIRTLGDEMVGQPFGCPRHVEQHCGVLERIGPDGCASVHQLPGKRASQAAGDLVERTGLSANVQPTHRSHRRDREVASEKSIAFQKRDRCPGSSRCERGAESRRPAATDHDVGVEYHLGLAGRDGERRPRPAHRTMPPRVIAMTSSARSISSSFISPASSTSSRMLRPVLIDSLMISADRSYPM